MADTPNRTNSERTRSSNAKSTQDGTGRLIKANEFAERIIVMAVVAMLIVASVLILWNSGVELWHGLMGSSDYSLTTVLSDILLALMIAEIIGTVSSFLRDGVFNPIPFLVVGIIASVRRLLVISAESAEYINSGEELPIVFLGELGILTFTIAVCAWSISILREKMRRTTERYAEEPAEDASTWKRAE